MGQIEHLFFVDPSSPFSLGPPLNLLRPVHLVPPTSFFNLVFCAAASNRPPFPRPASPLRGEAKNSGQYLTIIQQDTIHDVFFALRDGRFPVPPSVTRSAEVGENSAPHPSASRFPPQTKGRKRRVSIFVTGALPTTAATYSEVDGRKGGLFVLSSFP